MASLPPPSTAASELAAIGRRFYERGWVMGTSGNFSSLLSRNPIALAITASSVHKGTLTAEQILVVDEHGVAAPGTSMALRPSAESLLHVEIVRRTGAGAVLHTHSIWSTILSEHFAVRGALELEGYEMLKGLTGISTHESRELVPILDNDQNMERLAVRLAEALSLNPTAHAVLLRKHGVYTWGATLADAERHVEVLEFLFETVGRSLPLRTQETTYGTLENS
jgi:methylthioribulose-1-phosphate dehydratase